MASTKTKANRESDATRCPAVSRNGNRCDWTKEHPGAHFSHAAQEAWGDRDTDRS